MHCLNEQRMKIIIRGARRIFYSPLIQEPEIITVDVIDAVDRLLELFLLHPFTLGSPTSARLNVRPAFRSHRQAHIGDQLPGGFIGRQVKQLRGKVDHIAFLLTAEADEILIDLHARRFIFVKRTAHHTVAIDLVTVMLGHGPGADLLFDL